MAKKETGTAKKDHIKYVGNLPHVAVPAVGCDFTRNEPTGPFEDETIKLLTAKKDEKGSPEFIACEKSEEPAAAAAEESAKPQ